MEIERKWLIAPDKIPYNLDSLEHADIEQAYVSFSPVVRIRRVNGGEKHILTVKKSTPEKGIASEEYEKLLDKETFDFLLGCASGNIICKRRYFHPLPSGLLEEIDIFSGDLEGLAYMEIEFPDLESAKAYADPDWVIKDVTFEKEYKNASLAKNGAPKGK